MCKCASTMLYAFWERYFCHGVLDTMLHSYIMRINGKWQEKQGTQTYGMLQHKCFIVKDFVQYLCILEVILFIVP